MSITNPNIAIARRFYDYINGKADENWNDNFADTWQAVPAMPEAANPLAGYHAVIDSFRSGASDLVVENVEIIANEDVVAVRSRVTGTHDGDLFGMAPTGKVFAFTAMDIHRIINGKIAQTWHVEDFAALMTQIAIN